MMNFHYGRQVTEDDANDVVQLLQESLLDAYTDELGQIDAGRRGGISLAKQVLRCFPLLLAEIVSIPIVL